jgi:hypothetical protein
MNDEFLLLCHHWSHVGYDDQKRWYYLPCKLKSISGTWHLIFSDGYNIDTHYATKPKGFSKQDIIKCLIP